jgi:hypothetical protein
MTSDRRGSSSSTTPRSRDRALQLVELLRLLDLHIAHPSVLEADGHLAEEAAGGELLQEPDLLLLEILSWRDDFLQAAHGAARPRVRP